MPCSGPASAYGTIGKSEAAYFAMINEQGGVNGRKINFISRDDYGYSAPKTVETAASAGGEIMLETPFAQGNRTERDGPRAITLNERLDYFGQIVRSPLGSGTLLDICITDLLRAPIMRRAQRAFGRSPSRCAAFTTPACVSAVAICCMRLMRSTAAAGGSTIRLAG